MTLFQGYPFIHKYFHNPTCPFNYCSFICLNSRLGNFHISAFWDLREMFKCFPITIVNAGSYSQSSSRLGAMCIETSLLGHAQRGTDALNLHNPQNAHEVDRFCRHSCGHQKMLQTGCFLPPA